MALGMAVVVLVSIESGISICVEDINSTSSEIIIQFMALLTHTFLIENYQVFSFYTPKYRISLSK